MKKITIKCTVWAITFLLAYQPLISNASSIAARLRINSIVIADVPYSDSYFISDPRQRNDDLARVSAALSSAAYDRSQAWDALVSLGFPEKDSNGNSRLIKQDYYDVDSTKNDGSCAVTMGMKTFYVGGVKKELFAIVIRGTFETEWLSNFNIGKGEVHVGFDQAAKRVMNAFDTYYRDLERESLIDKSQDNNVLWITGHSRGGAVANLIAAYFDLYTSYAPRESLYAYTFASPRVTSADTASYIYGNIFNYVNPADLVTRVPLNKEDEELFRKAVDTYVGWELVNAYNTMGGFHWDFMRYGIDVILPQVADAHVMQSYFMKYMSEPYYGSTQKLTDQLVGILSVIAPSQDAAYRNDNLMNFIAGFMSNQNNKVSAIESLAIEATKGAYPGAYDRLKLWRFLYDEFYKDPLIKKVIKHTHLAESYLAWTMALPDEVEMQIQPTPVPIKDPGPIAPQSFPDKVFFGKYLLVTGSVKEPLSWRVLAREEDSVLLITEMVISQVPFHNFNAAVSWRDCTLREWLNSKFISDTFSLDEQEYIVLTTNNTEVSQWVRDADIQTKDRVFLLSTSEVEQYCTNESDRIAVSSEYADSFLYGIDQLHGRPSSWLLRSPGITSDMMTVVDSDGSINSSGVCIYREDYFNEAGPVYQSPIRPAIWVRADAPFLH